VTVSIKVDLSEVAAVAAQQAPYAYLLTVSDDGAAHAVAITVQFGEGVLACSAGGTSCRNATARPNVSLLWPPSEPTDYSLIVDGDASVSDSIVTIVPSRAVRHRPAAGGGSDCGPVSLDPKK
jgi:hypothetical protein